jgi:putative ABC transport system substrate-binding protein
VIGYLNSIPPSPDLLGELRRGLANGGFVEGQNVRIDYRSAEGRYDRLPQLAAELVRQKVNVIMTTGGTTSVVAAKAATDTIPIAGVIGDDPTRVGLAQSLGHPGGNVTGVAQLVTIAEGKRLEFIHAIAPAAPTVAYLANPELPSVRQRLADVEDRARALAIKLVVLKASDEAGLDAAFAEVDRAQIGALLVGSDAFFFMARDKLVALANQRALPTMYFFREFTAAGGLASYSTNLRDAYRALTGYVVKILNGARPADLPIAQQSEKVELVINLKTAKALGIQIPIALLARADEVIE